PAGDELPGALAAPNGVIAHLHLGVTVLIFFQPFFVQWGWKGGASAVQLQRATSSTLLRLGVSTGQSAATDGQEQVQQGTATCGHAGVSSGASAKLTTNVLPGVLLLRILKQLPGVAILDQIASTSTAGRVDVHERRLVRHTHGLLQVVSHYRQGVFLL